MNKQNFYREDLHEGIDWLIAQLEREAGNSLTDAEYDDLFDRLEAKLDPVFDWPDYRSYN